MIPDNPYLLVSIVRQIRFLYVVIKHYGTAVSHVSMSIRWKLRWSMACRNLRPSIRMNVEGFIEQKQVDNWH